MNQIFANRLRSARLLNGFSLQDLADKIDNKISRQAIFKYESGSVVPNSEMINILADALNVRPDYFSRGTAVEIGQIEFRKQSNFSSKEQKKVVEQTREYLSRYLELEMILNLESLFQNPLKDIGVILSKDQIDNASEQLREKWELGMDSICNVAELLEENGIKIISVHADGQFDGLQTLVNDKVPVIAYNSKISNKPDRIRFTLLHELGHLLLSFPDDLSASQIEKLCHQFAASMLLPKKALVQELGIKRNKISIQELGYIKKEYGISIQAIVMRALDCEIIDSGFVGKFFNYLNMMNWKIDEPISYDGVEKSKRFDQLLYRALSEEQVSTSKAAALKNMKLADFRFEFMAI